MTSEEMDELIDEETKAILDEKFAYALDESGELIVEKAKPEDLIWLVGFFDGLKDARDGKEPRYTKPTLQ